MRSAALFAAGGLALAIVGLAGPAAAAPAYPAAAGRCVDEVGVLGSDLCAEITTVLTGDEKATSDEIAVAVVATTGDATIETWSTGLFNAWGVGERDRNNGVLLVVAVDDHRVRLATGKGLTKRLGDAVAAEIINGTITPSFKDGEYADGILNGLDEVRLRLGHRIGAGTALAGLAAEAPSWTGVASDPGDQTGDGGEQALPDDAGAFPDGFDPEADGFDPEADGFDPEGGGTALWPFALLGFGVLAVIGIVVGIGRGASSPSATSRRPGYGPTHWQSRSDTSTSSSFSGGDSSSGGSSDGGGSAGGGFGGGSSAGGGSSGSW
jgi:uncharacterized protein